MPEKKMSVRQKKEGYLLRYPARCRFEGDCCRFEGGCCRQICPSKEEWWVFISGK